MLKNAFFASKSELRSTKSETISNDQNANSQNKNPLIQRFWSSSVSVISILGSTPKKLVNFKVIAV